MSNIWLTADLHLAHPKVAKLRGFDSVDEHDRTILSNIANTLNRNDHLWICGDLSSGGSGSERSALDQLQQFTPFFTMHLVAGNHDSVHPIHRKAYTRQGIFGEVFASIQPFAYRRAAGHRLWLSHFPYFGDGDRGQIERFPEVRLHDNGIDFLAHGHLHCTEQWTGPRSIHVGLDAWNLTPVNIETVVDMIVERATA
ncbi:metallophosphoesterase [Rhodococcus sp. (in: high G+C Gram-positive bacteria)]|uniref:metallophosphoesterase n=1 Tax=Rhodococcus sp. TaxID=1831 RepID=UPI00257EFE7E|nr:metallophosphoesterase [Rhodococcus sp. (in: high G+C Gram-positive bacteria)]MBQ7806354.1 metallophosphoesterase [Rhodococcus sp. (in: high G+C Gram-positive bacteria)]